MNTAVSMRDFSFLWNLILTVLLWHEYSKWKIVLSLIRETRNNCSHRSFPALETKHLSGASKTEAIICPISYTQTKCSWIFLTTFLKLRKIHPQPGGSSEDKGESKKASPRCKHRRVLFPTLFTFQPLKAVSHWIEFFKKKKPT